VIDEDATHHLRRHAEEVGAILPDHALLSNQAQIRLMNQGRRLQRVARMLLTQVPGGAPSQFLLDQRQEIVTRLDVPSSPRPEEDADRAGSIHHSGLGVSVDRSMSPL
jgi:hypothetical protein